MIALMSRPLSPLRPLPAFGGAGVALAGFLAIGCAAARPPTAIAAPMSAWGAPRPELEVSPISSAPNAPNALLAATRAALLQASARCPADMALVDDSVCVDRWEGSLFVRQGGTERAWPAYDVVDGHESEMRAVSLPGVLPQGYISGKQAALACVASGKRLCTGDEWERACRGPKHTQFPYGNERRARVCNDDIRAVHPVAEVAEIVGMSGDEMWRDGMNHPMINQLAGGLLKTGERAECTNDYGVFDMVGNLHEWIDDPDGTFRGGFYMDTTKNGDGCEYATVAHSFKYHDYSTGFRCCMDADRVE